MSTRPPEPDQPASAAAHDPEPAPAEPAEAVRAGRFWSGRRLPAGLTALVVLGAAGLLLYDIASVRADRPAMWWRRFLAGELAERSLDGTWVLAGAAAALALGVWLLVLAVTPGLRRILPMRRESADVRAGLDRRAAALALRDRAMEVPGVHSVRVRVRRSKAAVRAVSHFRELDEVRADLDTVLAARLRDLGLARSPGLSVHVGRPTKKG
ncbi:DUF6286 domain-containing protein [Streptomyces sp. SYSU K21746]